MKAAIYCRVSTIQQEPGTSLESQRASCRRLANEIGAEIVAEFQDIDSGAKEQIPGLLALTDAAARRDFDVVLVDHPDRFSRNLVKKVIVRRDLQKTGVDIRYAALRIDDTAEGRLMENMTAVIAEYERERIEYRTNRGRYAKARSGRVVGTGAPPYGYAYVRDGDRIVNLQPDPVTSPIMRRILIDLMSSSASDVAAGLNADGIPPPRGRQWHEASILKMARNPVYSGRAAYGQWEWQDRKVVGPRPSSEWIFSDVPALIEPALWERLQQVIADRRITGHARLPDDPFVLRSRLRCGHCGGQLSTQINRGIRYYVCLRHYPVFASRQGVPRCELVSVRAETLEDLIIGSVRAVLLDESELRLSLQEYNATQQQRRAMGASADAIERDLKRHEHRLSRLHDLLLDAEPASASWRDLRAKAQESQAQVSRLESERSALTTPEPLSDVSLASFETYAASVREEIDTNAQIAWPAILDDLRVRVTVRNDPNGWQIGRQKRSRFALESDAAIPIKIRYRKNVFSNIATPHRIRLPIVRSSRAS